MKVAIATLGCKVNQYDSGAIETRLRGAGWEVVPFAPGADAYVINTCTVTDRADAESRRIARRARRFAPGARVVMTGCFAQANPRAAAIPEVDVVVGLNRPADLLAAIRGEIDGGADQVCVGDLRRATAIATQGAATFGGQTRAFLKVQEGCDLFCSYCIVPLARGRSRSVAPRVVLDELRHLAALGYREVVLTGVHLGGYGADLAPRLGLVDLLEMIAAAAPVPRVRLSSVDPPEISPRLVRVVQQSAVICPHFHVPVQSGDDGILRRMRRRYSADLAREVIVAIHEAIPLAGIGADVIAGFPGEREEEFERTAAFVRALPFTYLHAFPYSRRARTTAATLPGAVSRTLAAQRVRVLREIDAGKRRAFAARMLGQRVSVLVEGNGGGARKAAVGYARNYARVHVAGAGGHANREVEALVVAAADGRLLAQAIACDD